MAVANNLRLFTEFVEYNKTEKGVVIQVNPSDMKYIQAICDNVEERIVKLNEAKQTLKDNYISLNKLAKDGVGSATTLSHKHPLYAEFIKYLSNKYNINVNELSYGNTKDSKKDYYEYLETQIRASVNLDIERNNLLMKVEDLENQLARLINENACYKREVRNLRQKLGQRQETDDNIFDISDYRS